MPLCEHFIAIGHEKKRKHRERDHHLHRPEFGFYHYLGDIVLPSAQKETGTREDARLNNPTKTSD